MGYIRSCATRVLYDLYDILVIHVKGESFSIFEIFVLLAMEIFSSRKIPDPAKLLIY